MATITIKVNNKNFPISCEDGQETMVEKAACEINNRIDKLKAMSPTAPTEYLLVLTAISLQNELLQPNQLSNDNKTDISAIENSLNEISSIIESLNKKLKNLS